MILTVISEQLVRMWFIPWNDTILCNRNNYIIAAVDFININLCCQYRIFAPKNHTNPNISSHAHVRTSMCVCYVRVCVCVTAYLSVIRSKIPNSIIIEIPCHDECVFAVWSASNKNWFKAVRYVYYTKDWIQIKYVRNYALIDVCVCVCSVIVQQVGIITRCKRIWISSLFCQLFR